MKKKAKHWYDYLWLVSIIYLTLGVFNIMFAWAGLLSFFIPHNMAVSGWYKLYCNRFCGRGQLFSLLGSSLGLSRRKDIPAWLRSKWFRYGFLSFFMIMFMQMLFSTYLVFANAASIQEVVTILWTFKLPWNWAYHHNTLAPWMAQFAFGFYSVMLSTTILGLITMALYKPRSWCVYCPMGTMTQLVCKMKYKNE